VTTGRRPRPLRWASTALGVLVGAGVLAAGAFAHAEVSPAVSLAGRLQLYTLAVPTEKSGVNTVKIKLTVPTNFSIDSFAPSPGWKRTVAQSAGHGSSVVQRITWTGGGTPPGVDSVFSFLAEPSRPGPVQFMVLQTYSDGSIVAWNGPESSAAPAPTIQAVASLTGGGGSGSTGGTSVVTIVAIVLAVLALVASGLALVGSGGGGRPLA
jgi:uncharacterized protein YcnI